MRTRSTAASWMGQVQRLCGPEPRRYIEVQLHDNLTTSAVVVQALPLGVSDMPSSVCKGESMALLQGNQCGSHFVGKAPELRVKMTR